MANESCRQRIIDELNIAWLAGLEPSCLQIAAWADCDIHTAYKHLLRLEEIGVIRIVDRGRRKQGKRWRIQPVEPTITPTEPMDLHN